MVLAATLVTSASAMADAVSVTSPDHARTYAYGAVTWHQLYLERTRGELATRITFSNFPFADANEPRTDQPFDSGFQVSTSISQGMHSLPPDAAANSFWLPGFEAIRRVGGSNWRPTQRFICSRRADA